MVVLTGDTLTVSDVVDVATGGEEVGVDPRAVARLELGRREVDRILADGRPVYGVNTGFGALCDTSIPPHALRELQRNLVRSHASGVGDPFPPEVVRAAMLLRANSLCRGHSGVRPAVVETLVRMLNAGVTPVVHSKGSLGASGDLAPLADLALVVMGEGRAWLEGKLLEGDRALRKAGIPPLELEAKEGLALLNGTAFMTALAALAHDKAAIFLEAQNAAAALSLEAFRGNVSAYAPSLVEARPHPGAGLVAEHVRRLIRGSRLVGTSARAKVQDPYSFRCVPQVHGAAADALVHVGQTLDAEINSTTDNPLFINGEVLSGGNFHGQPVGTVMDYLSIAVTSVAAMAERRVNQLLHPSQSGLPAFLIPSSGLNSGFMIAQYSAASLVNENRLLSAPASVNSVPVCADQEDHVSMATLAASKARDVVGNAITVAAIELLVAAQAAGLWAEAETDPERSRPLSSSAEDRLGEGTGIVYRMAREIAPLILSDTPLAPYIEGLAAMIGEGALRRSLRERGQGFEIDDDIRGRCEGG